MLIGAVAIAVALVGAAVLFNTVLYTASVSPQGANVESNSAQRYDQAVQRDAHRLTNRVANESEYLSPGADELRYLRSNTTNYSRRLAETVGGSTVAFMNVSFNESAATEGVHYGDDDPTTPLGNTVGGNEVTDVSRVEEFDVRLRPAGGNFPSPGSAFELAVDGSGPDPSTWTLRIYESGGSTQVEVETTRRGTRTVCSYNSPSQATVVKRGDTILVRECGATAAFSLGALAPLDIDVRPGSPSAHGTYNLTTDGTDPTGSGDAVYIDTAFDYQYDSSTVSYNTTLLVDVNETVASTSGGLLQYSNFEQANLQATSWSRDSNVSAAPGDATDGKFALSGVSNTGSQSLVHNGNTSSSSGTVDFLNLSDKMNTTGYDRVIIEYWAEEGGGGSPGGDGGPEGGEREQLTLQYFNGTGWENADRLDADGTPTNNTYHRSVAIEDPEAFGDHFRIRFAMPADADSDEWFLDDVVIRAQVVDR
jgi:hypothetical protein